MTLKAHALLAQKCSELYPQTHTCMYVHKHSRNKVGVGAHTHTKENCAEIAKPREMGNLSRVGKVVRPTGLWVWRPWLRLKPASQKGGL